MQQIRNPVAHGHLAERFIRPTVVNSMIHLLICFFFLFFLRTHEAKAYTFSPLVHVSRSVSE